MPDNWSFVIAAYLLAAVVLGAYWRHLVRKEREIENQVPNNARAPVNRPLKGTQSVGGQINKSVKGTEPRAPGPGHLRSEPSTRRPLP